VPCCAVDLRAVVRFVLVVAVFRVGDSFLDLCAAFLFVMLFFSGVRLSFMGDGL